jgi:hypothetical protein
MCLQVSAGQESCVRVARIWAGEHVELDFVLADARLAVIAR